MSHSLNSLIVVCIGHFCEVISYSGDPRSLGNGSYERVNSVACRMRKPSQAFSPKPLNPKPFDLKPFGVKGFRLLLNPEPYITLV